ncbi:hypothetical protein C2G38_2147367 [Gigaspora rosea]|uniref:Uncharacterized protein n=1 Tax=Gigaspora rosea TaxID=44941 RepID=A0A397UCJ3_9GLOM|nr:hypothetical protein C2G38_2147367 [Gigaspora rosea]
MRRTILTILFCIFFFVLIDAIIFKRQGLSNGADCQNDSDCASSICNNNTKKCSTFDLRKTREHCKVDKACVNELCVKLSNDVSQCDLIDSRDTGEACLGDNACASQCCRIIKNDFKNTCQTIDTRFVGFHCQTNGACASNICVFANFTNHTPGTCADCRKDGCINK